MTAAFFGELSLGDGSLKFRLRDRQKRGIISNTNCASIKEAQP